MKKDQSHITQMFLPWKHKDKNPTIIYYLYIMDHETISYKNLIQEFSIQYTIVSHCHTKIGKFMCQFTASRQPASTAQFQLIAIPEWMESCLPWLHNPHGHIQCVSGCMCAPTNVTTDSQTVPFTYISTGSPLDLTCMQLIVVNLQLHVRPLIVN